MTRRELLARSAAGGVLVSAAPASAQAPWPAVARTVRRGRAIAVGGARRLVVAHDGRDTVGLVAGRRRRVVDVGAPPVAVTAAGDTAAVVTAGWAEPSLVLLDLATGEERGRRPLGFAPAAVAYAGDRLLVAGGGQEGTLLVLRGLRVADRIELGRVPGGLAAHGDRAWVTLQADDRVAEVDLRRGRIRRERRVAALPDRIAAAPDGRLLLTHGGRDTKVSLLDGREVRRLHAGRQPSAVAFTAAGAPLVALGGEDAVVRLGARRRRRVVGAAPRDIAVVGRRFWVVSAVSGRIAEGRL